MRKHSASLATGRLFFPRRYFTGEAATNAISLVTLASAAVASGFLGTCIGYVAATEIYKRELKKLMETHSLISERLTKETERRASCEGIRSQLEKEVIGLRGAQRAQDLDTGAFFKSLTVPQISGRWGELGLRRIVELSGMSSSVDFGEQVTVQDKDDGSHFRIDMVIKLHGKRYVIVDSKAPLNAFEESLSAKDEKEEHTKLKKYVQAIRKHVLELSKKKYWTHVDPSPEFVIAFLPCEAFFNTALKEDPTLIEYCLENKVILASPITLIALLKVIEFGWKQGDVTKNLDEIKSLMKEHYTRTVSFSEHLSSVGKSLDTAVRKYNDCVGSMEGRLLPSTRKMKELGSIQGDEIPVQRNIDREIRKMHMIDDGFHDDAVYEENDLPTVSSSIENTTTTTTKRET